ncbi:RecF/RecN/SMC N terminal domain-containing protein [Streptoalloteichus hindustanus]|uniref:Nuclease SbcCD subunit C n=2 Tax=Streptoalloteichus hindustanus TaxID=2017 RepID=A0A1M5HGZ4_STRHI|nr:RecF/RecN/SMC N terminal domain-containing protein [Streptoalloteichus hindustanus]
MTEDLEHHKRPEHIAQTGQDPGSGSPSTLSQLASRLEASTLPEGVKAMLREALGEAGTGAGASAGPRPDQRMFLESISVAGFRGIGRKARLPLTAKPGVTLVMGRNGSGKSSFAEGVETAFTGRTARLDKQRGEVWRRHWRNLHDGGEPKVEVRLSAAGDAKPSTLTCTWSRGDVTAPEVEFKRPGQGRRPFKEAGWERALHDYRPFLSYHELDKVISGRPSELYDSIATILGLGELTAADERLQAVEKELNTAVKAVEAELPVLVEALSALDDPRAARALAAVSASGTPDFGVLDALVTGLPDADDEHLRELRAIVELSGPDLDAVGTAVDRLRKAIAALNDVRASGAEDAHQRAELLSRALDHSRRHANEDICPVCGADRPLDEEWAERAAEQVAVLRCDAAAAQEARTKLREAMDAVRYLVTLVPAWLPAPLAVPWKKWAACREIDDAERLAAHAETAALVLADTCAALREEAAQELEELDENWRRCVTRLAAWLGRARTAYEGRPRLRQVRTARKWLKEACAELREERLRPFEDHSQRVWEELRQQSNVDLRSVRLTGSEKAAVRKLVMDVSVDGTEAAALGVMSQGELHSLALSLFLPRAAAPGSPFGFVVIDDPVQSMDPAKVHGLAKVLHHLGETRQVVVFTHDTRLQRAFTNQELPVTVLEVERQARSTVTVRRVTDPVVQALSDAHALARTPNLPPAALTHVLPGLCRTVLERAFSEAAWLRLHRAGLTEHEAEKTVTAAVKLTDIAALGLFGDSSRTASEVYRELCRRCGPAAVDLIRQCQEGVHPTGTPMPEPLRFVRDIEAIAQIVRKLEVADQ